MQNDLRRGRRSFFEPSLICEPRVKAIERVKKSRSQNRDQKTIHFCSSFASAVSLLSGCFLV